MSELSIPEKCRTCPMILERQAHIDDHEREVDDMIQMAVSDEIDNAAESFYDYIQEVAIDLPEGLDSRVLAQKVREVGSRGIEETNKHIDEIKDLMAAHALDCLGPVRLHGEKNRRAYDITLCASPRVVDEQTETTVVKRSRI